MGPLTLARWLLYRGYNDLGKEGSPHLKTEEEKSVFSHFLLLLKMTHLLTFPPPFVEFPIFFGTIKF